MTDIKSIREDIDKITIERRRINKLYFNAEISEQTYYVIKLMLADKQLRLQNILQLLHDIENIDRKFNIWKEKILIDKAE